MTPVPVSTFPASMKNRLKARAIMLAEARAFFAKRDVTEVDVPILSPQASIDAHIDLITALYNQKHTLFLHTSPEYGMKRLLAEGSGDIYQLSHVFRDGELSHKHQPEFMMCEWYRVGMPFQELIDETIDFVRLFVGPLEVEQKTYRETCVEYGGIDPYSSSAKEIYEYLLQKGVTPYEGILEEGKDALLNVLLSHLIEPKLGQGHLFVLSHYPASQAALAKTVTQDGFQVAERFEIYYKGLELANGYHELADPIEQEKRLIESNIERVKLGKSALPIDTHFLKALKKGLPACSGVAVGFDRLMMLKQNAQSIQEVVSIPFSLE